MKLIAKEKKNVKLAVTALSPPLMQSFQSLVNVIHEVACQKSFEVSKTECCDWNFCTQGLINCGYTATTKRTKQGPCEPMSAWDSQSRPKWARMSQSERERVRESQSKPKGARVNKKKLGSQLTWSRPKWKNELSSIYFFISSSFCCGL